MNDGKILQIGSPQEVMNQPVDKCVANFVGIETILSGKVIKKGSGTFIVSVSGQKIEAVGEVPLGEAVILCIRPENVTLSAHSSREATSARNVFLGKSVKISHPGTLSKSLSALWVSAHDLCDQSIFGRVVPEEGKEVRPF